MPIIMKTNMPRDDEQFRMMMKKAVDGLEPADGCLEEIKSDVKKRMGNEKTAEGTRRFPVRRVLLIAAAVLVTAALGFGLFALLRPAGAGSRFFGIRACLTAR